MAAVIGTAFLDFGGTPTGHAYLDVTGLSDIPDASAGYKVEAWLDPIVADQFFGIGVDHNGTEHTVADIHITASDVIANTGFRINAFYRAVPGLTGTWAISYVYTTPLRSTMGLPLQDNLGSAISSGNPLPVKLSLESDASPLWKADGSTVGPTLATAYGIPVSGQSDGASRIIRVNDRGSVRAQDTLLFEDPIEGAAVNTTTAWTATATTQTSSQANGQIVFNTASTTTITTGYMLVSQRQFMPFGRVPLHFRARVKFAIRPNAVIELGFGAPSTATVVSLANGMFVRVGTGGDVDAVSVAASGTEEVVNLGTMDGNIVSTTWYDVDIFLDDDRARFVIRNSSNACVANAVLPLAVGTIKPSIVTHWSIFLRHYNSGAVTGTSQLLVSRVGVSIMETDTNKPWAHTLASMDRQALVSPTALTQLANWANSAAPASASLSNTAAGYTTLGGQFQFAAVGGAETDYALFAFAVPTGHELHITDIRIDTMNTGAAVATTASTLQWFIGTAAAATLASSSWRQALGMQAFAIADAIGKMAAPIDWHPSTPLCVHASKTLHIGLKLPLGTATASQIIRGTVAVAGYME